MIKISIAILSFFMFVYVGDLLLRELVSNYTQAKPLEIIDTGEKGHILSGSQGRLAVYGSPYLGRTKKPKIITLGGSIVREGFRPEDWGNLNHSFELHNLSVGGTGIDGTISLWKHVEAAVPRAVSEKSIIVVGVIFGMFHDDSDYYIKKAEGALGIFFKPEMNIWGWNNLNNIKRATLPIFATEKFLMGGIDSILKPLFPFLYKNRYPLIKVSKDVALARWSVRMGGKLSTSNIEKLLTLSQLVRSAKFKMIVVNFPLPSWHKKGSPFDQQFQKLLPQVMQRLTKEDDGVIFLDFHNSFSDAHFVDSAHLNPEGAKYMSYLLYRGLKKRGLL
jgi:hypothetical protein